MNVSVNALFPELDQPIRYPLGQTEQSLLKYLQEFRLDGSDNLELSNYLRQDLKRFLHTLGMVPKPTRNGGRLLEIGGNPYFMSILLRKFTDYDLSVTNYFGRDHEGGMQVQFNAQTSERFEFKYVNHNIEAADLPFEHPFDVILFCEVLEHLCADPVQAILRIKHSLSADGVLILTTPNVNRLENVARMIAGSNIYDPYSGYGMYGRHNREYNKHELALLLRHCGFEIEVMFSSDVHENGSGRFFPIQGLAQDAIISGDRRLDLGQYIFLRARNDRAAGRTCKPRWLYRSYAEDELCEHE